MRVDKTRICEILGVKVDGLKFIEKGNNLEKRLNEKGYMLLDRFKEGKKIIYDIEQINSNKEVYSNLTNNVYGVKKEEEFAKFMGVRSNDKYPLSKADISQNINISPRTVSRWDNILLDKRILSKDGFYYFYIDRVNNIIKQCSEYEYKSFWKNKVYIKAFKDLQTKYISGIITLNELQLASAEMGSIITCIENKYYYKIKKYKVNKENKLYMDTMELIKSIYGNKVDFKPNFEFIDMENVKFIPIINFKRLEDSRFKIKLKKIN